jgi:IS5 family transposase
MAGYNVQAVMDAKHHLIIAREVTNVGHDRSQLANTARQAREVTGADGLTVLADRGYFSGEEVAACEAAGVTPIGWSRQQCRAASCASRHGLPSPRPFRACRRFLR